MSVIVQAIAFGTALAGIALGVGWVIAELLDLNWVVTSGLLLIVLISAIYSRSASGPSGPTMRPAGAVGSAWGVQRSVTAQELQTMDHMMEQSQRQRGPSMQQRSYHRWVALPPAIALIVIIILAFL